MKIRKKIILFFIALTIAISTYFATTNARTEIQPIIQKQFKQEINEQTIINKLQSKATLTSLEGKVSKTYGQTDDMFNTGWNWLDKLGNKKYIIKAKGTFTMGMDLSEITQYDILVAGSTVIIKLPEVELTSLELPYEDMKIHNEDGLLRKEFKEKEIKAIHKEMTSLIKKDIKADKDIYLKSSYNAREVIREFIMMTTGVSDVKFSN
jgi:Protein of unknown function (DUF4230)